MRRAKTMWALAAVFAAACGARTGLGIPPTGDGGVLQGPADDGGLDGVAPAPEADASPDQVAPLDCTDAGTTLIYVFTANDELYSFYPPTLAFKKVGNISCGGASGSPFSMGVAHEGIAYILFNSGQLFRLDTKDAACTPTPYVPNQLGWTTFGMGYVGFPDGGETLYVTEDNFATPSKGLGSIDTGFTLHDIGAFSQPLPRCELTGTGDGRLYAFCLQQSGTGSVLAQLDPATANVINTTPLTVGKSTDGFAFAFWNGDFWMFTGSNTATVTRYDPQTGKLTKEKSFAQPIVGAGVSPCAPH